MGLKPKNPPWGEYGYFLEQHIVNVPRQFCLMSRGGGEGRYSGTLYICILPIYYQTLGWNNFPRLPSPASKFPGLTPQRLQCFPFVRKNLLFQWEIQYSGPFCWKCFGKKECLYSEVFLFNFLVLLEVSYCSVWLKILALC